MNLYICSRVAFGLFVGVSENEATPPGPSEERRCFAVVWLLQALPHQSLLSMLHSCEHENLNKM
jgi:hypothetical protein